MLEPNHICKNINCTKGEDGGRKHFYACDYCNKTYSWRSMACCIECYDEYMMQVAQARSQNKPVDLYPERTDKTHKEVIDSIENTTIEEAKNKTMEELSDYKEDIKTIGLNKTIDKINKGITTKNKKK